MMIDDKLTPISEEEIKSVFSELRLSSEEERRTLAFDSLESSDQTMIEIEVLTHTGRQSEPSQPLNA